MADVSLPGRLGGDDGGERGDRERGDRERDDRGDSRERSDRAQLILITGLTLAVLFVAVVLVLNTVIYTENLATRGVDAGGGEAVEFRESAAADVSGMLARTNWSDPNTGPADFDADVAGYEELVAEYRLRDGVAAGLDHDPTPGSYVAQDDGSTFEPKNVSIVEGSLDRWVLAENATRVRAYRMTLAPNESIDPNDYEAEAFRVSTESESTEWKLYVFEDEGTGDTVVRVDNGTVAERSYNGEVRIDLTAGTVEGDPWDALRWAEDVEDDASVESDRTEYDLVYGQGDTVEGTYELVVDVEDPGIEGLFAETYHDTADDSPYAVDAVYDTRLTVSHHTPELRYEDTVRVAPGERDA